MSAAADPPPVVGRREWVAVGLVGCAAFALMMGVSLTQWIAGLWFMNDVGNVYHMWHATLRGNLLWSPYTETSLLAYHFTPLLVLLAPLSLLSDYPVPLVGSYVLALAACVVPVHALARRRFGLPPAPAFAAGILFLCNHFVASIHLANHFESYFILGLLTTMAFGRESHPKAFWLAAVATLTVKEDAALWLGLWAGFEAWSTPAGALRRRHLQLAGVCVVYAVAAVAVIAWFARVEGAGAQEYFGRIGDFGPSRAAAGALGALLLSFCLLPLFAGRWLLLMLLPSPLMLGDFEFSRSLLYYYSYPFIPGATLAMLAGMATVMRRLGGTNPTGAARGMALVVLVFAAVQLALPTRVDSMRRTPIPLVADQFRRIEALRTTPPPGAPVVVQYGLWSLLPVRHGMRNLNAKNLDHPGHVVFDTRLFFGLSGQETREIIARLNADIAAGRRTVDNPAGSLYVFSPKSADQETTVVH